MRQVNRTEIAGMFGFGIDANALSGLFLMRFDQLQYFLKGRDFKLAIIFGIGLSQVWQPFLCSQCFQLSQREILGEPAGKFAIIDGLGRLTIREFWFVSYIGGFADLILVPRDQHSIFGQHQIGFNKIRALSYCQFIGCQRVFRSLTTSSAMGNDNRWLAS